MKTYVGLGSSAASSTEMDFVEGVASIMAQLDWYLITTRKGGIDHAFYDGAGTNDKRRFIRIRDNNFSAEHETIAKDHHTSWIGYMDYHRHELIQNVFMLLGDNTKRPVDALVYMQQKGDAVMYAGVINHAIRVAEAYKIPHFNILTEMEKLEEFLQRETV